MSLRPRYSLLTLLILTALVAGGVKLWYGPHRVVEQPTLDLEDEYTFTRNWHYDKIVHGPRVLRYFRKDNTLQRVVIKYYQHGVESEHEQEIMALAQGVNWDIAYITSRPPALAPDDQARFQESINQELAKLRELGFRPGITRYDYYGEINLHGDIPVLTNSE